MLRRALVVRTSATPSRARARRSAWGALLCLCGGASCVSCEAHASCVSYEAHASCVSCVSQCPAEGPSMGRMTWHQATLRRLGPVGTDGDCSAGADPGPPVHALPGRAAGAAILGTFRPKCDSERPGHGTVQLPGGRRHTIRRSHVSQGRDSEFARSARSASARPRAWGRRAPDVRTRRRARRRPEDGPAQGGHAGGERVGTPGRGRGRKRRGRGTGARGGGRKRGRKEGKGGL